jgi:acetaldehyde dehydrogenase (acetylating)
MKKINLLIAFLCFFGCKDQKDTFVYCKSKELLILKNAFDKESALIVLYRGDSVQLLGDTTYISSENQEGRIDSSVYYVLVKAKRGVKGWVLSSDLQKNPIKFNTFGINKRINTTREDTTVSLKSLQSDTFFNPQKDSLH